MLAMRPGRLAVVPPDVYVRVSSGMAHETGLSAGTGTFVNSPEKLKRDLKIRP
jgi:hypothetical protein